MNRCASTIQSANPAFEMRCDDNAGHDGPHCYETDKGTVIWFDGETP